jgi:hypothetical protein
MVFKKAVSNKRREASLCRWRPSNRLLHGDILEKIIELEINDWAGTPSRRRTAPATLSVSKAWRAASKEFLAMLATTTCEKVCIVCLEAYTTLTPPVLLTCKHSLCQPCALRVARSQPIRSAEGMMMPCPQCRTLSLTVSGCGWLPAEEPGQIRLIEHTAVPVGGLTAYTRRTIEALENVEAARLDRIANDALNAAVAKAMHGKGGPSLWWSRLGTSLVKHDRGGKALLARMIGSQVTRKRVGECAAFSLRQVGRRDPVYEMCAAKDERTHDVAWRQLLARAEMGNVRYVEL